MTDETEMNYETDELHTWIINDEPMYLMMCRMVAARGQTRHKLASALKDTFDDFADNSKKIQWRKLADFLWETEQRYEPPVYRLANKDGVPFEGYGPYKSYFEARQWRVALAERLGISKEQVILIDQNGKNREPRQSKILPVSVDMTIGKK